MTESDVLHAFALPAANFERAVFVRDADCIMLVYTGYGGICRNRDEELSDLAWQLSEVGSDLAPKLASALSDLRAFRGYASPALPSSSVGRSLRAVVGRR